MIQGLTLSLRVRQKLRTTTKAVNLFTTVVPVQCSQKLQASVQKQACHIDDRVWLLWPHTTARMGAVVPAKRQSASLDSRALLHTPCMLVLMLLPAARPGLIPNHSCPQASPVAQVPAEAPVCNETAGQPR